MAAECTKPQNSTQTVSATILW